MVRRGATDAWHARAPFWIGLALTALGGFGAVKAQLAVAEARHEAVTSTTADIRARLTVLESRCR
jgi:hypothetical protein